MDTGTESFNLLLLIANDCYRMGEFWYAAKAFDMLDRLEPNPEFWEGKRGAIVGVFQVRHFFFVLGSFNKENCLKICRKFMKTNLLLAFLVSAVYDTKIIYGTTPLSLI